MTNREIVNGFIVHDRKIVGFIYKTYFPIVEKLVLANQGTPEEAEDIFQEALLIIYRKIKFSELELDCKFSTYLYSICKHLCLQELDKKDKSEAGYYDLEDLKEEISFDNKLEMKKIALYLKHFKELGEECQKILYLHFNQVSIIEIMKKMGHTNKQYTIHRKYRCKQMLINSLISNPEYETIKNEIFAVD